MTSYWARYAWLPDGDHPRLAENVRFDVADGSFARVDEGQQERPGDHRLAGVLFPGLANGHSHAFHRALRGRTQHEGGTFWTWRRGMYALAERLDPDRYLALARAVYAEMALAGYTAVGEFHYLHHGPGGRRYADPNAMGAALIEAAGDAGLRLTLLDVCYLSGGLAVDGHTSLDAVQGRFCDGDVDSWQRRTADLHDTDRVRIGAAAHSVRAVPAPALADLAVAAGARPTHVHLSEQQAENEAALGHYGRTPTVLLADAGLLGPRTTGVHGTHLSTDDITRLGATGTTVCFCPSTERDLADGIGPARALIEAGSPLSLGSDQHAVIDPFAELRDLEGGERLVSEQRGRFGPEELITAATSAGYASLGWEGGQIAAGQPADFVAVRAGSVRTAGAAPDQLHYAAGAADVDTVVVGGRMIVEDGRHRLGDVGRMISDATADILEGERR